MSGIQAFVAHSFSDGDKTLIATFVEYFESLEGLLPAFGWDHALQAEPESIADKVLAKMEGKNVFIGICTRSECAVASSALAKIPGLKRMTFSQSAGQWKTSDWIIQEIGLAVGRKMRVIIFLEEGVRKPGGLFGDIEYIEFHRANPTASFHKLLQMLGSIAPKALTSSPATEGKAIKSDKPKEAEEQSANNDEAEADWDQETYYNAMFRAIVFQRDQDKIEKIDSAYRSSSLATGTALTTWESRNEFLRMLGVQKYDFDKIKRAAESNPTDSQLQFFLARTYQDIEEYEVSARTFEAAAAVAANEEDKLKYLASAACRYAEVGQSSRSREIMERLKSMLANTPTLQYMILSSLRDLAVIEKNDVVQLAAMEQMLEMRPSDSDMRFELAFKYSQADCEDMALHHYSKIPIAERSSTAWNNLGVAYGDFELPVKATEAFRISEREKDALAMCNLGSKLLQAGFFPEAQQESEMALATNPTHKNLPELLRQLSTVKENEETKLNLRLEKTKEKAAFCRKVGDGIRRPTPSVIGPSWNSPVGLLQVEINGTSVRIFGAHQKTENPFGVLFALAGNTTVQKLVTHKIEYIGELNGNVISGHVKRSKDVVEPSLLSGLNDGAKVLMVLNSDHTELFVMEGPDSLSPTFYTLNRFPKKKNLQSITGPPPKS